MKYRTIVADPPWQYEAWPSVSTSRNQSKGWQRPVNADMRRVKPLPYPSLSLVEIAALPISDIAEENAHLYLWTTNRYLRESFSIIESWGFRFSTVLAWCKKPKGKGLGGTWASNLEFVMFARRGVLAHECRYDTRWFGWPRMGNAHSRKPEAFLDMVEEASPGPYLELFARRQRLGWDTWGNEALEHVELTA